MSHVHFTFPEPLKRELERRIPPRERSGFVSQTTRQALQMKYLRATLSSKRHVGTYEEVDAESFVRDIRKRGRKITTFS